jgi:polar amino acid transport system permease protein
VSDFLKPGKRKPAPTSGSGPVRSAPPAQAPDFTINVTDGTLIPSTGEKSILSAWNISFFGAIIADRDPAHLSPKPYLDILSFVPDGLTATFGVTLASICFALVLGLLAGLGRIAKTQADQPDRHRLRRGDTRHPPPRPALLHLLRPGPAASPKRARLGDTAMSICYGAYMGEIFRAGIQSIPKGQMEAALALGMSRTQALWRIILPQTVKVILPPIGNEFIALLKDSSLVSILAVSDLLARGQGIRVDDLQLPA